MTMVATPPLPPVAAARVGPTGPPSDPNLVPPPTVPLGFLVAAGAGATAFGLAVWFAADRVTTVPTHPGVVAAAHLGVLAFLSTAVLGALHQFAPVVGRRPLRSVGVARASLVGMVLTSWLLPTGFAHGPSWLVPAAGSIGAVTVGAAVWNLSGPLASPYGGLPGWGLRVALLYFVATVAFGVVYAFDRELGWFPLYAHRVLAHAHLGLLGWLGLTYVAVAEKLWPMFLLAHRPGNRSGPVAVGGLSVGVAVLVPALLFDVPVAVWVGAAVATVGIAGHLTSLVLTVRHRRRPLELLHAFVISSALFLVAAVVLGVLVGAAPVSTMTRTRLVTAEVVALVAWIALAVVGHVHKIVPFIGYTTLRGRGITTGPAGRPLLFADLWSVRLGRVSLVAMTAGMSAVLIGVLAGAAPAIAVGGAAVALAGVLTTLNLAAGPRRVIAAARIGGTP